jgi:hypothetical protein
MAAEEEEEVQHNFTAEDGTTLSLRTSCLRRNAALLSSQRDLTGMSHWRAGSLLASLLACRNSSVLRGSAVCELGCGASALLAKRLLRPDGCLLLVYTPRYAGMAKGLRAAARGAGGVALRTIARHAALTPQLAASQAFPDTRILAASPCAAALQRWIARLGSPPEAPPADDSEGGEEGGEEAGGGHPLLAEVEGDLFA